MPRKPSPPAVTGTRPVILARVSTEEQAEDGYSLDEQVRDAREYCRLYFGVDVPDADVLREEGISGGKTRRSERPGLDAALAGIEARTYTHLVVHKLDRLARNLMLGAETLQTVATCSATFVSVRDHIDTSTLGNQLTINIMLAVAEWVRKNIAEEVRKGNNGRRLRGLHHGRWPFGAMPDPDTGILIPDERSFLATRSDGTTWQTTRYALMLQIFELVAANKTYNDTADIINALGARTDGRRGGADRWESRAVAHLVANRTYVGEISDSKGGWMAGGHAPLVPADLWEAAQASIRGRIDRPRSIPRQSHDHALGGGVLRCAACLARGQRHALHVKDLPRKPTQFVNYACYGRMKHRGCTEPTASGGALVEQVALLLEQVQVDIPTRDHMIAAYVASQGGVTSDIASKRKGIEDRRRRLGRAYADGFYTDADYEVEKARLEAQMRDLAQVPVTSGITAAELTALSEALSAMGMAWRGMNETERAQVANALFSELYVYQRQIIAYRPNGRYWPLFALACDGASFGDIGMKASSHSEVPAPADILAALPDGVLLPAAFPPLKRYYGKRPDRVGVRV